MLHQTPRSADEFRELLPLVGRRHRAIAMDMVGFGSSAALPAPQTIEQMAAGATALLDALGIDRAVVLGHHTGAAVAIELAAAAPERVRALVLSSPPWADAAFRAAHAEGPVVDEVVVAEDGGHLTQLWEFRRQYYPPGRPDLLDRFIRDALAPGVDPAEGHRACARYRMEERIVLVAAPTLLLGASADPFALPQLQPIQDHLTGAPSVRTVVLDGGTIPLMEQLPDEVAAEVETFLAHLS
jgi:pimeloyl-ACP methyl ester carboxylesterase